MERRRLLKITEVAYILGLKPQTIRNQLCRGLFPLPAKRIGGGLRWDEKEVYEYLEKLSPIEFNRGTKPKKEVRKDRINRLAGS